MARKRPSPMLGRPGAAGGSGTGRLTHPAPAACGRGYWCSRGFVHGLLAVVAVAACERDIATPDHNAGPRLAAPVRHQIVPDSAVVDLAMHFFDPDGDDLVFTVASSNTGVVRTRLADAVATLIAVVKGSATVTITATDPDGATATHSFPATVPNRAPEVAIALPDLQAFAGDSVAARLAGYFDDPDQDSLTFSAEPAGAGVASVAVAGDELTVKAIAPGTVTVIVTATDPEGLVATQDFVFTVPNRAPEVTDLLTDIEIRVGEVVTAKMSDHFADPDGEVLVYAAESSEGGVAGVAVSGDELVVSAVAKGLATITVTAADPGGLEAVQSFSVTVPNRAPEVVDTPAAIKVAVGDEVSVEVTGYFVDPDGDTLSYAAESSDTARAAVVVVGGEARVTGVAKGTASIAVTAMDPEGLTAVLAVQVEVPNRAPEGTGHFPDVEIEVGDTASSDLSAHFMDPDGDELVFAAATSDAAVVAAGVSGHLVMVHAVAKGTATVTVTATDTKGLAATETFEVVVPNRAPRVMEALPAIELVVSAESVTKLSDHFTDPDGDELFFAARSSDTAVATTRVAGDQVTVRAASVGTATVTVTAADSSGLAASQTFRVTVPNRGPVVKHPIRGGELAVGTERTIDLAAHIADPDGQALTFGAESSDTAAATAAVSGSKLTVRGIARGQATITVTATDPGGLAATVSFGVQVPNRGPRIVRKLRDLSLDRGAQTEIRLSSYFSDPDADTLAFHVESSDSSVLSVRVVQNTAHLRAIGAGRATVTVRATDPLDLSVAQTFQAVVTRRNRAPRPADVIPDQHLEPGDQATREASEHFVDPDGDELTFTAQSSDSAVALVTITDEQFTTLAIDTGTASVVITATDPYGLSAVQEFVVVVEYTPTNDGPRPQGYISDRGVHEGEEFTIDASDYFTDPDGDPLNYAAGSSNSGVAAVSASGSDVTVAAISAGRATITITATDPDDLTATQTFQVLVRRRGAVGDFDITLVFTDSVPAAYRPSLQAAATRWMSIVGDTEWTDISVQDTKTCRDIDVPLGVVDDLVIAVHAIEMDGALGTVARAGVCMAREEADGHAPILGYVLLDKVDLAVLEQHGDLVEVMIHEITHVLGFGFRWVQLGLLDQESDPHFTGVRATAAFDSVGGEDYPDAKVPTQPGQGHWRESVFGSELLTPNLSVNRREPLSVVTLAALADMSYHVDFSLADDYQLDGTQSDVGAMNRGPVISLADDFERGPVMILDRDGNVVRIIPGR